MADWYALYQQEQAESRRLRIQAAADRRERLEDMAVANADYLRVKGENERLRAALAVFANEANWERRRELEPPIWDADGDPLVIAREALAAVPPMET